jgi:hypothetical protein
MQLKHKVSFYQQTIFIHLNSRNVIIKKCPWEAIQTWF